MEGVKIVSISRIDNFGTLIPALGTRPFETNLDRPMLSREPLQLAKFYLKTKYS